MVAGQVIIGANYGDEGKGLFTDYFASRHPTEALVVRYNGGAQAGHTVVTDDGRRHVFSHFGSGTFADCPTFLSKFFITNPLVFKREYLELRLLGLTPRVAIDAQSLVTTPFDMFINQTIEQRRGKVRHGSCGLGVNETVTRSMSSKHNCIRVLDLLDPNRLVQRLSDLKRTWWHQRLASHGIDQHSQEVERFSSHCDQIMEQFVCDSQEMLQLATIRFDYPVAKQIIFEGAQGLMLDEDRIDQYPHVTRSKTGLPNVLHLAHHFGIKKLNVLYVSRTYLTRHGAGPLSGESDWSLPDLTNLPNQFQGTLRFAPLDLNCLQQNIDYDWSRAKFSKSTAGIEVDAAIAFTCADQKSPPCLKHLALPCSLISYGPARSAVAFAQSGSRR